MKKKSLDTQRKKAKVLHRLSGKQSQKQAFEFFRVGEIEVGYIYKPGKLVHVQIINKAGSQVENRQEWGIAHFLEHLHFKGTRLYPTSISFIHAYNLIGAYMNAYTDYDHTNYFMFMMSDVFEEGMRILADMYVHPLLPEEEIRKEKNPVFSEMREVMDDPYQYLFEEALKNYLSYYHPILGTKETLKRLTRRDLVNFRNRYFGRNNTLITVVGDVDPGTVQKNIEKYFLELPDSVKPEYPENAYNPGTLEIEKAGIQEGYVLIFYPALPYGHKDKFKQNFVNYILGGMDSSLLYERIREELGLSCYEIYSTTLTNKSFSLIEIFAGIAPDQMETLQKEIRNVISRLMDEYISEERFLIAKNTLKTEIYSSLETIKGLSNHILRAILMEERENPADKILEEMETITKEDVLRVARETFSREPFVAMLFPAK